MVVDPGGGNVVTVESMAYVEDDIDRELAADRARKEAAGPEGEGDAGVEADDESDREREVDFETDRE
jgi:hypothetical protein